MWSTSFECDTKLFCAREVIHSGCWCEKGGRFSLTTVFSPAPEPIIWTWHPYVRSFLAQFLCGISVFIPVGDGVGCGLPSRMRGDPGWRRCLTALRRCCMMLLARQTPMSLIGEEDLGSRGRKSSMHTLCSGHVCLGSLGACSRKNMAFGLMRTGSQSPLSFLAACSWRSYFTLSLDLLLYKIRL